MKLITVCDDFGRAKMLEESAHKFGWEYTPIRTSWRGFGTKLVKLYEYLTTTDIHDFVFADAYDVVVKGTPEQLMEIVNGKPALISSEVNCWPDVAMLERYEAYETALLVNEVRDLKDVIRNKPETNIELGEITQSVMNIVKSSKQGHTTIYNRYRIRS